MAEAETSPPPLPAASAASASALPAASGGAAPSTEVEGTAASSLAASATEEIKIPLHPTLNDPTITDAEKDGLAKLRAALVDCKDASGLLYSLDTRLVKYLRAREADVEKAATFFKTSLEFRQKNGYMPDLLLAEFKPPKEIFTHVSVFPVPIFHDKEGNPVVYNRAGLMYGKKICAKLGTETVCKSFAWFLEHLTRSVTANIATHPMAAPYVTLILDLNGFGSHCLGPLNCTIALLNVFQNLYPETLKRCMLVNSPWIFRAAWAVISPFIDKRVKEKISILRGSATDTIFKYVAPSQVPAFMGGKMIEDGDEFCGKSILPNGDPYAGE